MKANELMIGDWVQNTCGHKGMVIGFAYYDTDKDNEIVIAYHSNNTTWSKATIINPIPLTEEILKANGFRWRLGLWYSGELDSLGQEFVLNMCCEGSPYVHENYGQIIWHFNFVHELQHALRLCGFAELADNFKLK